MGEVLRSGAVPIEAGLPQPLRSAEVFAALHLSAVVTFWAIYLLPETSENVGRHGQVGRDSIREAIKQEGCCIYKILSVGFLIKYSIKLR